MPSFLQSVRVRTLVVMLSVVIAVLVGLGVWAHQLLRHSFERLEAAEAVEELQLARQTFDERCEALTSTAMSWSRSAGQDESRTLLAQLPGEAAVLFEAHLDNAAVPELGRVALSDETLVGNLPHLLTQVPPIDALHQLGTSGRAVIVREGRMLLVVWTYLVLPHGVIGAVGAGTWLDEAWSTRFGDSIHHRTRLALHPSVSLNEPQRHELDGPHGTVLQAVDEEELLGHARIDLSGGPLVLSVSLDRGIIAAGGITWEILMTAIVVTGGALVLTMMLLLDVTVLARLTRLGHRLAEIGQTNDQKSLVNESGADEVGRIGREINRLLASQRGWREQISRRNVSMRLIFDTLPIGLLSLDAQGRIQPDRSSATGELFGRNDLDGLDLGELLAPGPQGTVTRRRLSDYLAIVRAGSVDADELDNINPVKDVTVQRATGPSVLRLQFYSMEHGRTNRLLRRDGGGAVEASGVLVTISDISDEIRLAAEVERSQSDYQHLKAMAEDVELFHGFLVSIRSLVKQLNELSGRMGSAPDRVQLNDLQRSVRALRKGGEIFELAGLEQAARSFDTELVRYLAMAHLSDAEVRRCRYGVADLEAAVMVIERQFRALLGHEDETSLVATTPRLGHRIATPRTQEELRVAKRSALVQLTGLLVQPVRIGLAATIRLVVPMVRRRDGEVRFSVQGEDVSVDQTHLEVLNQILPHVVRFACDHGFDAPDQRERAGKPPIPQLTLGVERRERSLVVTLADDGKGIDPQRMRELAVEQGLMTREEVGALDDQAAQALVFSLAYDTEDNTLSGVRQVGFSLIVSRLKEELNAEVTVQSTPGQGTAVIIAIPLPML